MLYEVITLAGAPYVLYFYPKDDTPGCTIEAKGLRDGWDAIKAVITSYSIHYTKLYEKLRNIGEDLGGAVKGFT